MNIIHKLTMAAVLTAAATTTTMAASLAWVAGGSTMNWSITTNWVAFDQFGNPFPLMNPPGPSDAVSFEDAVYAQGFNPGWTTVPGAVNNIVDANTTIGVLNYTASAQSLDPTQATNHFYTTLIPAGVTLTVGASSPGNSGFPASLAVGDVPGSGQWVNITVITSVTPPTNINYSTITGAGTLNVTNSSKQISVGWQTRATLDLTGLNQFNANVSNVWIAASSDNPYLYSDLGVTGPMGWLLLAKTNIITTAPNLSGPGVLLGYSTNANHGPIATVVLGGSNVFNTDGLTIGGRRAKDSTLSFEDAYLN